MVYFWWSKGAQWATLMELDRAKLMALLADLPHTEIILYGSYAYGQPTASSDLDILLVSEEGLNSVGETEDRLEKALGIKVDLQVFSPKKLSTEAPWSTMIPDAVTRGIVLSPANREHSIYEGLAKEWSAEATARFYLSTATRLRNLLQGGMDEIDEDEELQEEMREWGCVMMQIRSTSIARMALWALLWSVDPNFSKQEVAGLSGEGKWAHWSVPSLLKALAVKSPESYEHISVAAEILLAKPTWRELFNDTKAAGNLEKPLVAREETKEMAIRTEEFLAVIKEEVAHNLEKRTNTPEIEVEATLA